jgi:hypothetical protein
MREERACAFAPLPLMAKWEDANCGRAPFIRPPFGDASRRFAHRHGGECDGVSLLEASSSPRAQSQKVEMPIACRFVVDSL